MEKLERRWPNGKGSKTLKEFTYSKCHSTTAERIPASGYSQDPTGLSMYGAFQDVILAAVLLGRGEWSKWDPHF